MSCSNVEKLLAAYDDGALAPRRLRAIEAHLADCAGCRHGLAQLRAAVRVVEDLEAVSPGPGFVDDVLAAVALSADGESVPTVSWRARGIALGVAGFIATALIVGAVMLALPTLATLGSAVTVMAGPVRGAAIAALQTAVTVLGPLCKPWIMDRLAVALCVDLALLIAILYARAAVSRLMNGASLGGLAAL